MFLFLCFYIFILLYFYLSIEKDNVFSNHILWIIEHCHENFKTKKGK